jgi:hypothetical protein
MKQYKYTADGKYMESFKNQENFTDQLETKLNFISESCDCYDVEECETILINNKKETKCKKYKACNTNCKK